MAALLAELADDIEGLGSALCCDPEVLKNHMVNLQGIDLVAQKARQMSLVLEADCVSQGVSEVRLETLRSRLEAITEQAG
ncbi:hypothetical protein [Aurantiacibacter poecillastricola]|uniref:hypothetical protein n=1 Tax=Aurantiacibacter poecillastricola TaxID=3064385 RepID=UPI0035A3C471